MGRFEDPGFWHWLRRYYTAVLLGIAVSGISDVSSISQLGLAVSGILVNSLECLSVFHVLVFELFVSYLIALQ